MCARGSGLYHHALAVRLVIMRIHLGERVGNNGAYNGGEMRPLNDWLNQKMHCIRRGSLELVSVNGQLTGQPFAHDGSRGCALAGLTLTTAAVHTFHGHAFPIDYQGFGTEERAHTNMTNEEYQKSRLAQGSRRDSSSLCRAADTIFHKCQTDKQTTPKPQNRIWVPVVGEQCVRCCSMVALQIIAIESHMQIGLLGCLSCLVCWERAHEGVEHVS